MRKVALIPARSGSKRIKDKNIYEIGGKPLIQYTLDLVSEVNIFDRVIVSTDSSRYEGIIRKIAQCDVRIRPNQISGDTSPDIQWVLDIFDYYDLSTDDALFILRPTSPLRSASFVIDAWKQFSENRARYDSLRAVKKVESHPGKMWTIMNGDLLPLFPFTVDGVPWHSNQTAALPPLYQQTASLEIVWGSTIKRLGSLSGTRILPYVCSGVDAFDVNVPLDLEIMKNYIQAEGL